MTIWEILQLLLTISEVLLCYWFCNIWLEYGKELDKKKTWIIGLLVFISIFTACNRTIAFFSYLIYIQQIFFIWIVFLALGQKRKGMCLLVIFNYHLLIALLDYIGSYIVLCFSADTFWYEIYFHVSGVRVLIFTITRLIILYLCVAIKRYSKKHKINIEIYRNLLIGLGIIGSIWMWWFQTILLKFKDVNKLSNVVFIFSCFVVLTAVLVGWFNVIYVKKQAQFIQMKNEALEKNYKNLRSLYENNQYIYHDFKNHMTLLKRYIKQNEYNQAFNYINRIVGPMEQLDDIIACNQEVLNLVVNLKGYEANQKGIRLITDIEDFKDGMIDETDLWNIMMNLLDNAIEASEQVFHKDKWINITIKKKKGMLIIRIENCIEKELIVKDGHYLSNKDNKSIHGLGIKSVKTIVEKYEGEAEWSNTEDKFTVIITFFENGL